MERVNIAKVAVSAAPYAIDKPYDYLIPIPLGETAVPGVRVTVPFGRGNRPSEGIILSRSEGEKVPGLKPLEAVLDPAPLLDAGELSLALWMRRRYFCTFYEAAKAILPAGFWYRVRETWRLAADGTAHESEAPETAGIPHAAELLDALRARGGAADTDTLRTVREDARSILRALETAGIVRRETDARRNLGTRRAVELAVDLEEALAAVGRRSETRREAVRYLAASGRSLCADVSYYTGVSAKALRGMEKAGLVVFSREERPFVPQTPPGDGAPPPPLTEEQAAAYRQIAAQMDQGAAAVTLLQGVTGSGKTQVYLHLARKALDAGKSALVLVPEIALTPQLLRAFSACFGDRVALLHSSLRPSDRCGQWRRLRSGEARVALGTRSAVFAPVRDLGLIILDEEQEGSYQSEAPPRYHARDVAKYRCVRSGAVLVLGSATPSVETAYAARAGTYQRALLTRRYNDQPLPQVVLADMREEVRAGRSGLIGADLRRELAENLDRGEQSILLLNRRGSSRMLVCGECGCVPDCPRCSVPMTYHSANGRLMCHYCGHSQWSVDSCPRCGGIMKRVGAGTQRAEEELRQLFPGAEVLRMDADTASGRHEELLTRFEKERIPILLGTQMVAKGLDFDNVTLAGVLLADLSLYVDHYRAAERTFSLLTQVVGRAGRGEKRGRAVIQTYSPDSEVILAAAEQNYAKFYDGEIRLRRLRRYPPFADLMLLTISGVEESAVLRASVRVRDTLRALPFPGEMEVLGPAPAPILKVNNRYRYRVTLAGRNDHAVRDAVSWLLKEFARDRENRGLNLYVDCNGPD